MKTIVSDLILMKIRRLLRLNKNNIDCWFFFYQKRRETIKMDTGDMNHQTSRLCFCFFLL